MKKLKLLTLAMLTALTFTGCFDITEEGESVTVDQIYGKWELTSYTVLGYDTPVDNDTYFYEITPNYFITYDNRDGLFTGADTVSYTANSDGSLTLSGGLLEYHTILLNGSQLTLKSTTFVGEMIEECTKYTGSLPPASWNN